MVDTITKEQAKKKYAHVKNPCRFVANHDLGMAYRGSCISPNNPKERYDRSNACPCDFSRGRFNDNIARTECKFHMDYLTKSTVVSDMVYEKEQQRIKKQRWDNRLQMLHLGNIGFKIKEWIVNKEIKWKIFTLLSAISCFWFSFSHGGAGLGFLPRLSVAVFLIFVLQIVFVFWFVFEAIFRFIKNLVNFILGK